MPESHRGAVPPAGRGRPRAGLARRLRRTTMTWLVALVGLGILVLGPALVAGGWYVFAREQADRPEPYHLGQEVRSDTAVFVVHEVRCGKAEEDTRNGRRCEVTVTARNEGEEDLTIPGDALMLHGPEGVRYLQYDPESEPFGTLSPGQQRAALIQFDIPPQVPVTHVGVRADRYGRDTAVAIDGEPLPLRSPSD